jgi:hypothetical protein
MSMEINFTNRETYLVWRANWKTAYKAQSQEIRDLKRSIKQAGNSEQASYLQRDLHFARQIATRMMLVLAEAKALAKASRETQHQQAA